MKNQAGFFLCGSLQVHFTNLLARKAAFLKITSEVNRTIRRCLFIVQSPGRICHFLPITKFSKLIGYELS